MNRYLFLISLICMPVLTAVAADQSAALPPPTAVQDTPESRETIQPAPNKGDLGNMFAAPKAGKDVQVRVFKRKDGATVEEYSLHGRVYMVKISPSIGTPPYYLYDNDGDGNFERRMPGGYKYIHPPEWVIQRF